MAVEDESPAFFANIVLGDVIIAANGVEVLTPGELTSLVGRLGKVPLTLRILRNLNPIEVEVKQ
jgi:S1-C subfamily serine protease